MTSFVFKHTGNILMCCRPVAGATEMVFNCWRTQGSAHNKPHSLDLTQLDFFTTSKHMRDFLHRGCFCINAMPQLILINSNNFCRHLCRVWAPNGYLQAVSWM